MRVVFFVCVSIISQFATSAHRARIIGGIVAETGQFPWEAAILLDNSAGRYLCGGALISQDWVLTAAQCVYGATQFNIHLGSNTILSVDENRVVFSTTTYLANPDYNQNTLENDIALIKLPSPVTLSDYITTIALPDEDWEYDDIVAIASGWGQTRNEASGISNNLYYVNVTVISNSECQAIYGDQIKPGMVCTVGQTNEGICIGDTGGPLVIRDDSGNPLLIGVASFMSQNGCESSDPNGYTRTSLFHDWITNITSTS